MRRAGSRDLAGRARSAADAGDAARRSGAADRRDGRRRGLAGRRSLRARPPRVLLSRSDARGFRRRHRHAVGRHQHQARTQRRVSASRSRARRCARPARRAAGGDYLGRRDSRQRAVSSCSPSPTKRWSARSTRISRSRAWPATCSCSGTTSWRIRRVEAGPRARRRRARAPRRRFRSGAAKRRAARGSCRAPSPICAQTILEREASSGESQDSTRRQSSSSSASAASTARRGAGRALRARGRGGARRAADDQHRRRRAVLRRGRRHAAGAPRAVRRAHQPRVGTRAAQALLPLVQLRAAGRRDRQRHRHLARASSTAFRSSWSSSS